MENSRNYSRRVRDPGVSRVGELKDSRRTFLWTKHIVPDFDREKWAAERRKVLDDPGVVEWCCIGKAVQYQPQGTRYCVGTGVRQPHLLRIGTRGRVVPKATAHDRQTCGDVPVVIAIDMPNRKAIARVEIIIEGHL